MAGDTEPPGHLRGGDQEAFDQLTRRHHASTVRLAAAYVADRALAEQAARDTWLDALEGIDGQGGLEVKTWLFRLLIGPAAAAAREDRPPAGDPAAGPGRFDATGGWACPPRPWPEDAGQRLRAPQGRQLIGAALADLRPRPAAWACRATART